jgi:hypothetical protein
VARLALLRIEADARPPAAPSTRAQQDLGFPNFDGSLKPRVEANPLAFRVFSSQTTRTVAFIILWATRKVSTWVSDVGDKILEHADLTL